MSLKYQTNYGFAPSKKKESWNSEQRGYSREETNYSLFGYYNRNTFFNTVLKKKKESHNGTYMLKAVKGPVKISKDAFLNAREIFFSNFKHLDLNYDPKEVKGVLKKHGFSSIEPKDFGSKFFIAAADNKKIYKTQQLSTIKKVDGEAFFKFKNWGTLASFPLETVPFTGSILGETKVKTVLKNSKDTTYPASFTTSGNNLENQFNLPLGAQHPYRPTLSRLYTNEVLYQYNFPKECIGKTTTIRFEFKLEKDEIPMIHIVNDRQHSADLNSYHNIVSQKYVKNDKSTLEITSNSGNHQIYLHKVLGFPNVINVTQTDIFKNVDIVERKTNLYNNKEIFSITDHPTSTIPLNTIDLTFHNLAWVDETDFGTHVPKLYFFLFTQKKAPPIANIGDVDGNDGPNITPQHLPLLAKNLYYNRKNLTNNDDDGKFSMNVITSKLRYIKDEDEMFNGENTKLKFTKVELDIFETTDNNIKKIYEAADKEAKDELIKSREFFYWQDNAVKLKYETTTNYNALPIAIGSISDKDIKHASVLIGYDFKNFEADEKTEKFAREIGLEHDMIFSNLQWDVIQNNHTDKNKYKNLKIDIDNIEWNNFTPPKGAPIVEKYNLKGTLKNPPPAWGSEFTHPIESHFKISRGNADGTVAYVHRHLMRKDNYKEKTHEDLFLFAKTDARETNFHFEPEKEERTYIATLTWDNVKKKYKITHQSVFHLTSSTIFEMTFELRTVFNDIPDLAANEISILWEILSSDA